AGRANSVRENRVNRPCLAAVIVRAVPRVLYLVKRRQQRPCLGHAAVIGIASEAQHAAAATLRRFKAKDGFDRIGAGAPHVAGRSAIEVYLETRRTRAAGMRCKLAHNRIRAADRLDVPAQGEHIAPMAVSMKQPLEARAAWRCECCFELRQPTLRNRRDGVRSGQHWRYPGWRRGTVGLGLKLAYPPK